MAGLAPTFPEGYDFAPDAAAIWQSFNLHDGQRNAHLLIRYIEDRRENAERWTAVLEQTDVALSFVWGMLDPVSVRTWLSASASGSPPHRSRRWRMLRIGRRSRHQSAWPPRCVARSPRSLGRMPAEEAPAASRPWIRRSGRARAGRSLTI